MWWGAATAEKQRRVTVVDLKKKHFKGKRVTIKQHEFQSKSKILALILKRSGINK